MLYSAHAKLVVRVERVRELSFNESQNRKTVASSASVATLLLVLFAHAFWSSATHVHRVATLNGRAPEARLAVSDGSGNSQQTNSGGHAQCVLCRLQRDFVSDPPNSGVALASPKHSSARYLPGSTSPRASDFRSAPSVRGPPVA